MPSEAGIADCRVSECDKKTVPRCGTRNRKCSTAVCGQSVTWDHKFVLLSRPEALSWHDSADWDDMVQQIVRCTAVQTPMNSDKFIHQQVINKTKQIHSATKTTQFAVRNSGHLQRNPACGVESNNRVILLIWRVLHLWEQTSKAKGVYDTW